MHRLYLAMITSCWVLTLKYILEVLQKSNRVQNKQNLSYSPQVGQQKIAIEH